MRIAVIGTGYVGLTTGACLADTGNEVACHDVDRDKIAQLELGVVPFYEPGLSELVTRNQREGRLAFTTSLEQALRGAEICFIAVGTPSDADGSADCNAVFDAARGIGQAMQGGLCIAVKSTVPVGTCEQVHEIVGTALAERGVAFSFEIVSNPEFLKEGKAIEDFMWPDRIVVGAASELGVSTMRSLYDPFIRNGRPFFTMDLRSAEMAKYAANVMLATRISLVNELAQICDKVGADIMQVRLGMGSDSRIGMPFLYPGIGYGGSCFPKDVLALSRLALQADVPAGLLDAVDRVNRHQKLLLANRVIAYFGGDVRGRRFALWGLAFKPDTDDIRDAPALTIIKRLTDAGAAICAYDPEATANARTATAGNRLLTFAEGPYPALEGADALIIATEWRVFRKPDLTRLLRLLKRSVVFDGRNLYDPREMRELGFEYHCIGRAAR